MRQVPQHRGQAFVQVGFVGGNGAVVHGADHQPGLLDRQKLGTEQFRRALVDQVDDPDGFVCRVLPLLLPGNLAAGGQHQDGNDDGGDDEHPQHRHGSPMVCGQRR